MSVKTDVAMTDRPNVVMIMTDNQGAWTLGCYGNEDIRTPGIDALAARGVRFSNAYCVNSVCSPSRATWFTGLIPSQHGVHCFLGGEKPDAQMGTDAYCTIEEFENLPSALHRKGYACGLSGKWHLGDSLNPQLGFDYWFTKPKGGTSEFCDSEMIWQGEVYKDPR
jgi:arylsulfatase A-like enzyme